MRRFWAALLLVACGRETPPAGQFVVHVQTDAPSSMFDRLSIEVFEPGASEACSECKRELTVDDELWARDRASFGVVGAPGLTGYRVRARLFRSLGGGPRPASTLDKTVSLGPIPTDRVEHVAVMLATESVATPAGSPDSPLVPDPLQHPAPWPGASAVPCATEPEPDEVCVPGGAYWMGDPTIDTGDSGEYDGRLERLVVLSPFFVDQHEVTVKEFRASELAKPLFPGGPSDNPHEAFGNIPDCTYTSTPGELEDHPVNCLSWSLARAYCEKLGRRLPTEAELEYLMSAGGRYAFPWGNQTPDCEGAIYGREKQDDECAAYGLGTQPVGSATVDRAVVAGGQVLDLAGNVREWAADRWQRETEACWGTGLFRDPRCDEPSVFDADARVVRGGGFESPAPLMRSALRTRVANEDFAVSAAIGFRCVRSSGAP